MSEQRSDASFFRILTEKHDRFGQVLLSTWLGVFRPELRWFATNPANVFLDFGVGLYSLEGVVFVEKFAVGKDRVNLGVADNVYPKGISTSKRLGDEVMLVDAPAGYEFSPTEGTGSEVFLHGFAWVVLW